MRVSAKLLFRLFALTAGAAFPAGAATVDGMEALVQPWSMACDEDQTCTATRTAVNAETGNRVVTLAVSLTATEQVVTVTTPLGVAVQPGIRVIAGEDVREIPVQVCYPTGCLAAWSSTVDEMRTLARLEAVEIRYFPFRGDAPLAIRMDIDGLDTAIAEAVPWRADLH